MPIRVHLDRILLERAGFLLARSERLHDADVAMRMSAEARRIIASLRKRVPTSSRSRDMPSLRDRWSDEDALAASMDVHESVEGDAGRP